MSLTISAGHVFEGFLLQLTEAFGQKHAEYFTDTTAKCSVLRH